MRTIVECHHCGKKNGVTPVSRGWPACKGCRRPLAWVVDATAAGFDEEANASLPVLVDFWAAWCGPCRTVAPALESLGRRLAGKLKVVRVNVDDAPQVAQRFQVTGVPALVLLRGSAEVTRRVGAAPERELEQWLRAHGVGGGAREAA